MSLLEGIYGLFRGADFKKVSNGDHKGGPMRTITVNYSEVQIDLEELEINLLCQLSNVFGPDLLHYCYMHPPIVIQKEGIFNIIGRSYSFLVLKANEAKNSDDGIPVICVEEEEVEQINSLLEWEYDFMAPLFRHSSFAGMP
jgi:hypothetical protein